MQVKSFELLRCDAGWRTFAFLKLTTSDAIVGWSEYNDSFGSPGLTSAIQALMPHVIGLDPLRIEYINAVLNTKCIQSRGGVVRQAIGAIENALLDIKGKALGVPVYQLFGGLVRDRIPVYWSHCGTYRMRNPEVVGATRVTTYADMTRLGAEVKARGFKALKTNVVIEVPGEAGLPGGLESYRPGFVVGKGFPERNWDSALARAALKTVQAFRDGCGPDVGIMLDLNFNFHLEGYRRIAAAVAPVDLDWLEIDLYDPVALRLLRNEMSCPLASCETLLERRDFKPYFENYSVDVAIIDVIWNGFNESLKIAAMADVYDINVAPHNFCGHLATVINAHFCASVCNFRTLEIDIDAVPWRDELVNHPPVIENGELLLPTAPGWGVEVNEVGVRAHPPKAYK